MTDLAYVPDHTAQALGLLIDQYQGLPRFSGLVASFVNRVQEFEDILSDVINKRLLDYTARDGSSQHAVTEQLDAIGRLVGTGRNGQSDATYLTYVRAQIFINISRGRRADVISLLTRVESTSFTYSEYYPATAVVEFTAPTLTAPSTLLGLARRVVNGGVRVVIVAPATGSTVANTFAFSNFGGSSDPNKSFGHQGSALYGGQLPSEYT